MESKKEVQEKLLLELDEWEYYAQAQEKWGAESQVLLMVEKLAELQKELLKYVRWGPSPSQMHHIAEEMADVQLMTNQITWTIFTGDRSLIKEKYKQKYFKFLALLKED